jgi:hypothetical protein
MRSGTAYLILPLLFAGIGQQAFAQRAGLWEAQTAIDGAPVGAPVRECRIAGAQVAALQSWPANCVAQPLHRTRSGIVARAECGGRNSGLSVSVQHESSSDLDRHFKVVGTTRINGVNEMQVTTVTLRYLGSCTAGRRPLHAANTDVQPAPTTTSWLATVLSLLAQAGLMLIPIGAVGLAMRRRWKRQRNRVKVVPHGVV